MLRAADLSLQHGFDWFAILDEANSTTSECYPSAGSYTGDGGAATSAKIYFPTGVAVDPIGNLYIADSRNERICKVGTKGIITTVAGNGDSGYSGDGVAATSTSLFEPEDIVLDASGNLFIADTENRRIRRVATNGIITTVAGGGEYTGFFGQLATNAYLGGPVGLAVDAYGDIFMAQTLIEPPQIAKVTIEGSTLPLNNITAANSGNYDVVVTGPYGSVTSAVVSLTVLSPPSISIQPATNQVAIVGNTATFSVTASGTGPLSYQWQFDGANLLGATGSELSLTDLSTNATGSYDVVVTNNYGSVTSILAKLSVEPLPIIAQGPSNQVAFLGGTTTFSVDVSGAGPFEYQWQFNGADLAGPEIITVAGNNSGDAAKNMLISYPLGLAVDASGSLFFADEGFHRICKIDTNGILTTVTGAINSEESFVFDYFSGDGGPATNATMSYCIRRRARPRRE